MNHFIQSFGSTKVETNSTAKSNVSIKPQLPNTFRSVTRFGVTGTEPVEHLNQLVKALDKQLKHEYRYTCELKQRNEMGQFQKHQKHLPHTNLTYASGYRR